MKDKEITIRKSEYELLLAIAKAASELPFGQSIALPWCRESFPKLDKLLLKWEKTNNE